MAYEIGTPAGRYAESRILMGGRRGTLKRLARAVAGCDPSVETIVLLGKGRGMLEVVDTVRAAFPGILGPTATSLVKIRTTRPVLLLFDGGAQHPTLAVQQGRLDELQRLHGVLAKLREFDADLVAEPVGVVDGGHVPSLGVVRGLAGWPWFSLARRFAGRAGFDSVTAVAVKALQAFGDAASANIAWRVTVCPRNELESQLRQLAANYPELAAQIPQEARMAWLDGLEELNDVTWHFQHGDFCVNNLLIDDSRARIVDFEEFGLTAMPLHDEFGLALSLGEFAERLGLAVRLEELIHRCTEEATGALRANAPAIPGLLAYHLCWRLNQCATRPTRLDIAQRLILLTRQLAVQSSDGHD